MTSLLTALWDGTPSLFGVIAGTFVVMPFLVLLHELGHAVIARFLSARPVAVEVGGSGPALRTGLFGIGISLRGWRRGQLGGIARYDPRAVSAVGALLIALAGPVASALGAWIAGLLLVAGPAHGAVHALLWSATLNGWALAATNLVPFTCAKQRCGGLASDGLQALRAARRILSPPGPYDPRVDARALRELGALGGRPGDQRARARGLADLLKRRPDLAEAVNRRVAAALDGLQDAPSDVRREAVAAAMHPEWVPPALRVVSR